MIEPNHPGLSITRQCELVSISRSSYYGPAQGEPAENLELMRLIDLQFLETPWYGSRQMTRHLRRHGHEVNRKRVRRLMARMGLQAVYQRPKTTVPHPEHKIWPYLLRDLTIDRPDQVWCSDITYSPMRRGFLYLVAALALRARRHGLGIAPCSGMAAVEHDGRRILHRGRGGSNGTLRPAGHLQHRSGQPVHQPPLHRALDRGRHPGVDGRARPVDGQRIH